MRRMKGEVHGDGIIEKREPGRREKSCSWERMEGREGEKVEREGRAVRER